MRFPLACTFALALAGCRAPAPPAQGAPPDAARAHGAADDVPEVVVEKDSKELLFSFRDDLGEWHDVDAIEKIPEASRARVLVRDLARSPEELRTAELLYVADLRAPDAEGRYSCAVVSRYGFERAPRADAESGPASGDAAAPGTPNSGARVTMYMTSWCPVCKKAAAWLRGRGVQFAEKDVEKDEAASRELSQKAKSAGLSSQVQGVPVIDVGGELLLGFDPRSLQEALDRLRAKTKG
jgi:glutaredoxin